MFRLLIVDDEEPIADGLYEVFRTLDDPALDVYKAYSAVDALRFLGTTRVDVVLSDIHMPGMNGLQLLEEIRKLWPKCRVVFLTGYDEFEYVYSAIRHKGVSYLLKADSYDEVIESVRKAVADIDEELETEALIRTANERMAEARELMRDNYLSGIISGRYGARDISQQQFDDLGIPLRADLPVYLMAGRAENLPKRLSYSERFRRLYGIRAIAEHYLDPLSSSVCAVDETSHLVWLIQPKTPAPPPAEGAVSAETYLKENAALVQDAAASSLSLALSLAVDVGSPWEELSDRIDSLKMLLNYRIGRESGRLLIDKSAVAGIGGRTAFGPLLANRSRSERQNGRPTPTLPGSAAARRAVERLAEYLENGDREEFFACLDEAAPREAGDLHDLESVERYYAIALVLLSYLNRWSVAEKAAPLVSLHKLMNADAHSSWDEAVAYLRRLGNVFFDIQDADTERRAADSVGLVQTHILEHVREADELTLARLADLAHLNPSYLSRLFKQVAGLNLSEYIARMRVAEAKRLLTDPAVKIHEVAETLGYGTATNFTRFFKKFTNLTPQEYRERSLRSADAGRPEVKS